jgi:fatty-acyl-CoA synthase
VNPAPDPGAGALHQRWQALVAAAPQALALRAAGQDFRRADLQALAEAEARALREEGVLPGHIVAWLGLNTPQMLALLLACARLGAVFLPLNWRLAEDELVAVCQHAGVALLRGSADQRAMAARLLARGAVPQALHEAEPPALFQPANPVLLLAYTSGTTGLPKGALHSQAGMLANAQAAQQVQGLGERSRTLTVLPLFHVGGLCIQTLPTLLAGGQVALHPRFEPVAWLAEVQAWQPSHSLLVPATMRAVQEHAQWPATDLRSLRGLYCGSSVVPAALIHAFARRGVPCAQVYGSTETGPFSIAQGPSEALARIGQVGRAAPGVQVRLVDGHGADVAPGQVGEIWLAGANLMRGYHREPQHPDFVDGWFHTGDLARRDAQGHHEVVGRRKDMIISGGENIYPAEIENLVATVPGVVDCAVVGLPDSRWGEVPVLVVQPGPGVRLSEATLRAAVEPRLARYKHPRHVVLKAELPRTALGKVQKAALVAALVLDLAQGPSPPPA